MRLVGHLKDEKQARFFCAFLRKQRVQGYFEPTHNAEFHYQIWVEDEDSLEQSLEWLHLYETHPDDPIFSKVTLEPPPPPTSQVEKKPATVLARPIRMQKTRLTNFILLLCIFLFFWNAVKEVEILRSEGPLALQVGLTNVQRDLIFDFPIAYENLLNLIKEYSVQKWEEIDSLPMEVQEKFEDAEKIPTWRGIYNYIVHPSSFSEIRTTPMFEKIKQGQIWRIFTPCFLHRDFLHILFNMAWLWILGKQMEPRLGKWRMLFLLLIIGGISNTVQYLTSGPYFLGFSGIAVGMTSFIWIRQKKAPWEGYPLQKEAIYFLFFFVLAMFALQLVSFFVELFSVHSIGIGIANAAHIAGGLVGIFLGRFSFFSVK